MLRLPLHGTCQVRSRVAEVACMPPACSAAAQAGDDQQGIALSERLVEIANEARAVEVQRVGWGWCASTVEDWTNQAGTTGGQFGKRIADAVRLNSDLLPSSEDTRLAEELDAGHETS